ncbi:outer membrane protein [Teredinibacter turnerae T7901]|uniref:Outer membrane protein n=1 Tax=Teredinibacter turnerae (strain ATCC 39867 / T7901) TaxID=377629 RepID=C5BIR7_TERTT|nr:TonB-dependent receptor [Teredinibacter turnerae]ACR14109.1 outer membrane protein [Teredinibacter turnerae T7901]
MKKCLLASAIAAISTNAFALSGTVVDLDGNPVPNARIEVVGSKTVASSDANGAFNVDEGTSHEIHVTAAGFSHEVLHLDEGVPANLTVRLRRSAIEQVDVIGLPIHASAIESAQPITVLSGEELRNSQAATLGDTLENEVGVHTSFHGNVASTPIIRGLSGPRVLVTQNSLDVSDVSRVGPDHAVSSEVSTAEQVEVLRGPATLFYGSGAIGGVVNVVDKRVPTDSDTYGEYFVSHETVNDQDLASVNLNTGVDKFAVHLDGFWRESDNYKTPVAPDNEPGEDHSHDALEVANSDDESNGYTLGSSFLLDNGYVGISVGKLNRQYGIPGHAHDHGEEEGAAAEPESPERVFADLEQDRYQLISEIQLDNKWLSAINTRIGYTDYTHSEIENGEPSTTFNNKTTEFKLDVMHQPVAHWKGGVVLQYKSSDAQASGEEAFTPPSDSDSLGLAIVEERHFNNLLVQLGARVEQVNVSADEVRLPALEFHVHEEGEHEEEEHEHDGTDVLFAEDLTFNPVSLSAGLVWEFTPGYNAAIAISHAERAPSAAELFSFGAHMGTRSYEVGALFELHDEGEEGHFDVSGADPELETSNNIDLTFRKHEGDFGVILNAFYNQVDNYYYQTATGFFAEGEHEHEHDAGDGDDEAEEEHEHGGDLPVYAFTMKDAELYGFEAQGIWQVTPAFKATVFSDYVHAQLADSHTYIPRTPPMRFGTRFEYQVGNVQSQIGWSHYSNQDDVAPMETSTEGYDWVDASINWTLPLASTDLTVFLKVDNLTDTEARVHTSFLKDLAPKPGRNFRLGLRGTF